MTLIEFHEFLKLYSWEFLITSVSVICAISVFYVWMEWREKQISKNWKEYVNANS